MATGATSLAVATPGPALRLNEVVTHNTGSREDADGGTPDWVELYNPEATTVGIAGYQLTSSDDTWTLDDRTIDPGGFLVLDATDGFSLDNDGDLLTLLDPRGAVVDELTIPALADDQSYGPQEPVTEAVLLTDGATGRFSGAPADGWEAAAFADDTWASVVLPVGFDGTVAAGEPGEVAFGMATTQSSDGYGYTGAQAVDGDPATFSHTADNDLDPYWEVDLGGTYTISHVQLVNRFDCCADRLYNITVSIRDTSGATTWSSDLINPVSDGGTPVSPGSLVEVDTAAIGRYVRVSKHAIAGAGEWLSLAEVAVTGAAAAPYAGRYETDVSTLMEGSIGALRVPFDSGAATRLVLDLAYDDGFTAWIDGAEVGSANAGAPVAHDATTAERFQLAPIPAGAHVLAVQGDNADTDDFLLAPTLTAQTFAVGSPAYFATPTPGEPNGAGSNGTLSPPGFDPPRGFYDADMDVVITAGEPGATLVYTTDGSKPASDNGTVVVPASDEVARATVHVTTTSLLRAATFLDGWDTSTTATHTYLYLADVVTQPAAPAGFPATWDSISEGAYAADYAMDPDIGGDELLAGLRDIPTLSIVTSVDDLFGPDGIYSNSAERGDQWERRASLEWILPDGTTGFAEDTSLQIHGYGWRYHSSTLKHSFRLQFKPEYGASKLDYPLFPDAPVDRFDSIVLRAGGSKTWLDFRDPTQAQYLHDSFARDTARDMGKVDGHATYVHLYLDGLYWGLYMAVERPDAGFAEEYFGGDDEDYDAINRRTTTNEAIDGDLEAYTTMLALADADLSDDANVAALEQYLDVDDLIDWMLIHQYMSNHDGPCCAEGNNQRGIRRREDGAQYRFFVWDMEYSLWTADDTTNVSIDVAGHASHAYTRLWANAGFRQRYSDRAHELLTGDGALTPAACAARYEARADEIYRPLLAESARWGDTYREPAYTRDVEWEAEYTRLMDEYFPYRTDALIAQLQAVGLYTP